MRLFIAREAVDHHLSLAFDIVNPKADMKRRLGALSRSVPFYLTWYPSRWLPVKQLRGYGEFGNLSTHMRFIERATRKLGRSIFHAMVRYGPKLERRQLVLFRAVDIGAELFAMAAACSRARMLERRGEGKEASELADLFCREARERIVNAFRSMHRPLDRREYKLAMRVMKGEHRWLEEGVIGYTLDALPEQTPTQPLSERSPVR
jgi:hypothetical protein